MLKLIFYEIFNKRMFWKICHLVAMEMSLPSNVKIHKYCQNVSFGFYGHQVT